ncbi:MAG: hypothetical protein ACI965_000550, partial [Paraglaciecola sp.]
MNTKKPTIPTFLQVLIMVTCSTLSLMTHAGMPLFSVSFFPATIGP